MRIQRQRYALAGAAGALLWALQQPLDQRLLRHGYDDVDVLARMLPRGVPARRLAGLLVHVGNGAVFGLAYAQLLHRRGGRNARSLAWAMALTEHVALFPLGVFVDRAQRRGGHDAIFSGRAFAQATWRHAVLGAVLAEVAARDARAQQAALAHDAPISTGRRRARR